MFPCRSDWTPGSVRTSCSLAVRAMRACAQEGLVGMVPWAVGLGGDVALAQQRLVVFQIVCLFGCLFVCLFVCLCVCLLVCLFICLFCEFVLRIFFANSVSEFAL